VTLAPILWLLAFIPALVALYFLKLRRTDVVVSSTLLWKRALEDFHVNAPFQKLRRNLLLLLQLLALAALIFSVWRPRVAGEAESGRRRILLVDVSASMGAKEPPGETRLEKVRRGALEIVRGMEPGDRMALPSFSSRTTTIEPFTDDRALLESRLKSLSPTAIRSDLRQALIVAHSLVETMPEAEVYVLGDGTYAGLETLPSEVKLRNLKLLGEALPLDNAAVTEIDVRRTFEGESRTEVFALVENLGKSPVRSTVSLKVDGELRDAREVELGPDGSQSVVFDLGPAPASGIASVSIDAADALPLDDEAWARVEPPRKPRVILTGPGNPWLELALAASPGLEHRLVPLAEIEKLLETARPGTAEQALAADVIIFDRTAPAGPPPLPAIYIGCLPALPASIPAPVDTKLPPVLDWDRSHPVNRFIVYTDLHVEEAKVFRTAPGFRSLVDAETGSLAGIVEFRSPGRPATPAIVIGFDILKSNWPLGHYSFPIFFANAVAWLGAGPGGERPARYRAGETLVHHPPAGAPAPARGVFRSPSGREHPAEREESGAYVTSATDEAGLYELVLDGAVAERFPVALLDRSESRLVPAGKLDLGDFAIEARSASDEAPRDLWKWFALLALGVVILEWRVYTRRLG
jgi:hypothetical protein